ncbi:MAG: hypothetical protein JOZ61_06335 [Verrucomicrobia bacterium]|jgi:hypothetical protein|nr:hypothetical protein [Verrucomicrobiota bacterium]
MKKFLLSLVAVAAVLLPMSQNAQAQWGHYYYHRYYHHGYWGHPYAYAHHRYWHAGYWYGGVWYPGYWAWAPGPVIVISP